MAKTINVTRPLSPREENQNGIIADQYKQTNAHNIPVTMLFVALEYTTLGVELCACL